MTLGWPIDSRSHGASAMPFLIDCADIAQPPKVPCVLARRVPIDDGVAVVRPIGINDTLAFPFDLIADLVIIPARSVLESNVENLRLSADGTPARYAKDVFYAHVPLVPADPKTPFSVFLDALAPVHRVAILNLVRPDDALLPISRVVLASQNQLVLVADLKLPEIARRAGTRLLDTGMHDIDFPVFIISLEHPDHFILSYRPGFEYSTRWHSMRNPFESSDDRNLIGRRP
jgi:hypothetical protein